MDLNIINKTYKYVDILLFNSDVIILFVKKSIFYNVNIHMFRLTLIGHVANLVVCDELVFDWKPV